MMPRFSSFVYVDMYVCMYVYMIHVVWEPPLYSLKVKKRFDVVDVELSSCFERWKFEEECIDMLIFQQNPNPFPLFFFFFLLAEINSTDWQCRKFLLGRLKIFRDHPLSSLRIPWETRCTNSKIPAFQILRNFSSKRWRETEQGGGGSSPLVFPKISFPKFSLSLENPTRPFVEAQGRSKGGRRKRKKEKKIAREEGTDEREAWNCLKHSLIICKSDKSPSTKIPRRFFREREIACCPSSFPSSALSFIGENPSPPRDTCTQTRVWPPLCVLEHCAPLSIARNGGIFRGQGRRGGCLNRARFIYIYIY